MNKESKGKYNQKLENMLEDNFEPDCEDYYFAEIETKAEKYDSLIKYLEDKIKDFTDQVEYIKNRKVLNSTPERYIKEGYLLAYQDLLEKIRSGNYK